MGKKIFKIYAPKFCLSKPVVQGIKYFNRLAIQAMRQFHPDVLATVQAKALFSKPEESLLGGIASVSHNK